MNITTLQALVIDALEDVKASDIVIFDTTRLTSMFDRLVIASGTSNRQTKALAASVRDKVRQAGGTVVSIEGEETGEWVLVDLGDLIVHIMQPPIRAYYQLEEIWGGKTIDLAKARDDGKPKPAKKPKTAAASGKKPAVKKSTQKKAETAAKTTGSAKSSKAGSKTAASKKTTPAPAKPMTRTIKSDQQPG